MMKRRTLYAFTESLIFTEDLLSMTDDETLYKIQSELAKNPHLGDVIQGTSGARKGRISNPARGGGKSGGFRFIYIYLEKNDRFYLLAIYDKKEQTDLTSDQKKELGKVIRAIKKQYGE